MSVIATARKIKIYTTGQGACKEVGIVLIGAGNSACHIRMKLMRRYGNASSWGFIPLRSDELPALEHTHTLPPSPPSCQRRGGTWSKWDDRIHYFQVLICMTEWVACGQSDTLDSWSACASLEAPQLLRTLTNDRTTKHYFLPIQRHSHRNKKYKGNRPCLCVARKSCLTSTPWEESCRSQTERSPSLPAT